MSKDKFWYGFDFDGTLAKGRGGVEPTTFVDILKLFINLGRKCKIFTARTNPEQIEQIKTFLKANNIPEIEITNVKDRYLRLLYDNRAVGVIKDTGITHEQVFREIINRINIKDYQAVTHLCEQALQSLEEERKDSKHL